MNHSILISSIALIPLLVTLNPILHAKTPSAASAETIKWDTLVEKKLKLPAPEPDSIICIGSSHMERWTTIETDLAPLKVVNRGIAGSQMKHAADLFVPKLAIPFKPRAVVLYEGSNDLSTGSQPEEILKHFQRLHSTLHSALPETRLYVLSIVPSPGARFEKWDAIKATNYLLKQECATHPWMRFVDTTSPLLGADGKPNQDYFIPNNIHMNPAGYAAWTSVVYPILLEAENPPRVQ